MASRETSAFPRHSISGTTSAHHNVFLTFDEFWELLHTQMAAVSRALVSFNRGFMSRKSGRRGDSETSPHDHAMMLATEYLRKDPDGSQMFSLWESDALNNNSQNIHVIMDAVAHLIECSQETVSVRDSGLVLTRKVLSTHFRSIKYGLSAKKPSLNKAVLRLLTAIVQHSTAAAKTLQRTLDLSSGSFPVLARKRSATDRWCVRALYVRFVCCFFHVPDVSVLAWALESRVFINAMFWDLEKDPAHTIKTVLLAVQHLCMRTDLVRKQRVSVLSTTNLIHLAKLYTYHDGSVEARHTEFERRQKRRREEKEEQRQEERQQRQTQDSDSDSDSEAEDKSTKMTRRKPARKAGHKLPTKHTKPKSSQSAKSQTVPSAHPNSARSKLPKSMASATSAVELSNASPAQKSGVTHPANSPVRTGVQTISSVSSPSMLGIDLGTSSSSDDDFLPVMQSQQADCKFQKGDFVWAKFQRFPYWPAIVQRAKGMRCTVRWIGWSEEATSIVNTRIKRWGDPKATRFRQAAEDDEFLQKAIVLADRKKRQLLNLQRDLDTPPSSQASQVQTVSPMKSIRRRSAAQGSGVTPLRLTYGLQPFDSGESDGGTKSSACDGVIPLELGDPSEVDDKRALLTQDEKARIAALQTAKNTEQDREKLEIRQRYQDVIGFVTKQRFLRVVKKLLSQSEKQGNGSDKHCSLIPTTELIKIKDTVLSWLGERSHRTMNLLDSVIIPEIRVRLIMHIDRVPRRKALELAAMQYVTTEEMNEVLIRDIIRTAQERQHGTTLSGDDGSASEYRSEIDEDTEDDEDRGGAIGSARDPLVAEQNEAQGDETSDSAQISDADLTQHKQNTTTVPQASTTNEHKQNALFAPLKSTPEDEVKTSAAAT
eukprot:m.339497 g.339497  ORF g.339497 m.339497 type:complete len:881 (+) comp16095_c3_seq1:39-2681(+)